MTDSARTAAGSTSPSRPDGYPSPAAPPDPRKRKWFRGDLDGLRAVAVLLVVAYHAHLPGMGGGFTGVDVFLVISGYLITTKLVAEVDRSHKVNLLSFWGRRIRRLVAPLALMLVVVLVLAMIIRNPLQWGTAATQARAAALYVSNFYYAAQPTGYFGADLSSSLFLHTWSLGVEEQFYLLWPFLFLGVGLLSRRRPGPTRRRLFAVVLGFVFVASLITSIVLTRSGSTQAYFGLPSRAWEFAAAGLFALVTLPVWLRRAGAQVAMVAVGLAAMLAAAVVYSSADPYPGLRGLLPVGGALLVLAGGTPRVAEAGEVMNPLSQLLAIRPAQWLGRVSYSWYLWHWPLIILAVDVLDRDTTKVRVAGAVVALGVAAAAHYLVENPIRFSSRISTSRRLTYLGAAALTLATIGFAASVTRLAQHQIDNDPVLLAVQRAPKDQAQNIPCGATGTASNGLEYCIDGDLQSDRTIVLFGDSHAGQWRPALGEAAQALGLRLVTFWKPACPSIPVAVVNPFTSTAGCKDFQKKGAEAIVELDPAVVFIANSTKGGPFVPAGADHDQRAAAVWADGYRTLVEDLQSHGIVAASIIDNPVIPTGSSWDPLVCLADTRSPSDCRRPRSEVFVGPQLRFAEASVQQQLDVPVLDLTTDDLCDAKTCGFYVDGVAVLADGTHLTVTYTESRVPAIEQFLNSVLASAG